ncbi:hypothetical protein [Candidatus Thiodictyon syntrophicum]|nr:hypothetical protein [Candidatus Thiodictyon syntrophicum]
MIIRALTLLPPVLLCLTAAATELHDSGYGDDSLVDSSGHYYYPQPNGGYMDAYGSTYSAIGGGLYTDALGNLLDVGTEAAEPARGAGAPPAQTQNDERNPVSRKAPRGRADASTPAAETAGGESAQSKATGDFGSRYLEDVGDGYLKIDPREVAADPRLAEPESAPDHSGTAGEAAKPAEGFATSDPDWAPAPVQEGPSAHHSGELHDLSPVDPGKRLRGQAR